ncbi:MAG: hypothetical protein LAT55_06455 [Opitutales bacterium]|nr:hypothetical protein [Opitutales bacterium]
MNCFRLLGCLLRYSLCLLGVSYLSAQEWPAFADRVEIAHNGSTHAYWVPTDASVDEPLRVIVRLRGAGGGLSYPDQLMDAYAADLSEAEREPLANPAGDGVPNLLKYALGLDPRERASREALPQMVLEEENGETYLTLHIQRNSDLEGVQLLVEYSEDLANWVNGSPDVEIVTETAGELVARSTHPVGSEKPRQFLRVRVEM